MRCSFPLWSARRGFGEAGGATSSAGQRSRVGGGGTGESLLGYGKGNGRGRTAYGWGKRDWDGSRFSSELLNMVRPRGR